jgi:D-alanyl-lipoteichoic acid acyltransferase DltB (MBOAT superfamily)
VYRGEVPPERNVITYFAFISFFPHMVAGPIQRAHHLLAQLNAPRVLTWEKAREATWLLAYGYFLKLFIANGAAPFVDRAFVANQADGVATILGTLGFSLEIYADFLGYSIIARGAGLLLGIEFIWNFDQPYVSQTLREFWRRWHISLSSWLRDYLYLPLGGNRGGRLRTYRNLLITMTLGGLWHGAAWNFALWGLWHGLALVAEHAVRGPRDQPRRGWAIVGWARTMVVVAFGWFLFRCRSWEMIVGMLRALAHLEWRPADTHVLRSLGVLAAPLVAIEVWQRRRGTLLAPLTLGHPAFTVLGGTMLAVAAALWKRQGHAFIYFQF